MFFNSYQTLDMEILKSNMGRLATTGEPQEEFLYANINEFHNSDRRKLMIKAQAYYGNDNDINEKKRQVISRGGTLEEAKNLSNKKLSHPFLRKLTNQKVNYLLGKEFTITSKSKNTNFEEALSEYINLQFKQMIKTVGRDAIINSIGWIQPYYDREGKLKFKRIPSEEVIPFWADADHTVLDAVLRYYSLTQYEKGGATKEIVKVEFHTREGVWYYVKGDKGLEKDPDKGEGVQGHFVVETVKTDENGVEVLGEDGAPVIEHTQMTWSEAIPFIPFKYNADELSLLKWVKPLIDDYDDTASNTSDTLTDVPNSVKVVKGYDGTDKGEFVRNLNTYRTAFVAGDGDMTAIETKMDITAVDSHLNRLRKDIYDFGCCVDTQEADIGNASGVALKFRYADLDEDMDSMGTEFAAGIERLVWFIKTDLANKGKGDFTNEEVVINFNTQIIINDKEVIDCAAASTGIVSNKTILTNHPWVTDVEQEQKQIDEDMAKQQETKINDQLEYDKNFGTTAGVLPREKAGDKTSGGDK